jgi:hypothetical protein
MTIDKAEQQKLDDLKEAEKRKAAADIEAVGANSAALASAGSGGAGAAVVPTGTSKTSNPTVDSGDTVDGGDAPQVCHNQPCLFWTHATSCNKQH